MKPQRPYLLRGLYDWIIDSDEVPYVLVDAEVPGVSVPTEHVQDGQIVLNLGPSAVRDLHIGEDYVMCSSRFSGKHFELCLPMLSIKAIYSKESAQGMVFPDEEGLDVSPSQSQIDGSATELVTDKDRLSIPAEKMASDRPASENLGAKDKSENEGAKQSSERPHLKLV